MAVTVEALKLERFLIVRPFEGKKEFWHPGLGEDPQGVVLAKTIEFSGTRGSIDLSPIKFGDKIDDFRTPLGPITTEVTYLDGKVTVVNSPLKLSVLFVVYTTPEYERLLEHRPRLCLGGKLFDVSFDQEQNPNFGHLLSQGGGGFKVNGSSLLTAPDFSKVVSVLLPHDLSTLSYGIRLTMQ